jgi:hypothetical protein
MKVSIKDGTIPSKTIFKLVTVGFSVASLILFAPFFLGAIILLSSRSANPEIMGIVMTALALPIVLVAQAALVAVLVNFGLYVYRRFRPVTYERE